MKFMSFVGQFIYPLLVGICVALFTHWLNKL
ncbi:MAG TPA: type I toxin-antitoxin system Fst family toxin [Candidatus Ligilactobacillus avistercoris]|nr:type I toxin-antitoxin system Fst family toxin [Candidatus Ligilactobacillus avistercoris]